MRTIELNIYKFEELSPETQTKVIEKNRLIKVEEIDWWDFTYDHWYEKLKKEGFISCKIWFSGFWNQGDGACFDCDDFDIEKLMAGFDYNPIETKILRLVSPVAKITKNSSRYFHYNTRSFELDYEGGMAEEIQSLLNIPARNLPLVDMEELDDSLRSLYELLVKHPELKRPNVSELCSGFEARVEELRVDLCKQIYRELRDDYDGLTSDEDVRDYLNDNMEFTEQGEIWS